MEKPCNSMGSLSKLQNSFDQTGKCYVGISSIVSRSDAPTFRLIASFMLDDATEAATEVVLFKKGVFKIFAEFTGKGLCQSSFLIKFQVSACNSIKMETLTWVSSCKFCEIYKNNLFIENP